MMLGHIQYDHCNVAVCVCVQALLTGRGVMWNDEEVSLKKLHQKVLQVRRGRG
jgi:hypothetical protein